MSRNVCSIKEQRLKTSLFKPKKETWVLLGGVILFFAICMVHALSAGSYADFYPMNGTFQNYNPVRRLFDGQIPYSDFQDYLGLGHLYIGSFITWLLGGSYTASLVAFSFLAFVSFAAISFTIGKAIFKKATTAIMATNAVLLMVLIQPFVFSSLLGIAPEIASSVLGSLSTGNSARFLRGGALPVSILLFCLVSYIFEKHQLNRFLVGWKEHVIPSAISGCIGGMIFVWSNDYGISCWVCLALMVFWVTLSKTRSIKAVLLAVITELVTSIVSICVVVEILTFGNLFNWIHSTFGTGSYQHWYYNSSAKSFYIFNIDWSYFVLLQGGLALVYLWKIFKDRASIESVKRYGVLAYANITSFCAVNEYKLLSGGYSREFALSVLFVTVLFETVNLTRFFKTNASKVFSIVVSTLGVAWCISCLASELSANVVGKVGVYIEEMGGYVQTYPEDLLATKEFLNGEEFFATYASAQELVCNTFQPAGIDYIIHVLGDKTKADYLETFNNGTFKYAATLKDTTKVDFSHWEFWVQRANWFFYRELHRNWHPVYSNQYEMYWERNEDSANAPTPFTGDISVVDIDSSRKKIMITTDPNVNGIADVYLDYSVEKDDSLLSKLTLHSFLNVQNTGELLDAACYESNNLAESGQEYIPIPIVNGYGETILTSYPDRSTFLNLYDVNCNEIYTTYYKYIEVLNITNSDGGVYMTIPQCGLYERILSNSNTIQMEDTLFTITDVEILDNIIKVYIDGAAEDISHYQDLLKNNNMLPIT